MPNVMETAELMKQKAIEGFKYRIANPPRLLDSNQKVILTFPLGIDNSQLYAGSAMIYYCDKCGWPCDIKHEEYFLSSPRNLCGECDEMDPEWLVGVK